MTTPAPSEKFALCYDPELARPEPGRGHDYGVVHLICYKEAVLEKLVRKDLIDLGAVYVEQARNDNPNAQVLPGFKIRIHSRPRRYQKPKGLIERLTTKTEDYYIVNKPAGLPVHALVDNSRENLLAFLEADLREELFITHRLDVETSGLVLVARNPASQAELNRQISNHQIKRIYEAYTRLRLEPGPYVHFMALGPTSPKRVQESAEPGWLKCELKILSCTEAGLHPRWRTIETRDLTPIYKLEIELLTGRSQQIRAQLARLHAPILGDGRYGSPDSLSESESGLRAIALFASRLLLPSSGRASVP